MYCVKIKYQAAKQRSRVFSSDISTDPLPVIVKVIVKGGQYDGTTPWTEFLHRFESWAKANYWSAKTMAVQLKFCMVGAAGAIIHRNSRSTQWDYVCLVEEIDTAYGPSSQHAAAVAIELRQRVRKPGEALHVWMTSTGECQ